MDLAESARSQKRVPRRATGGEQVRMRIGEEARIFEIVFPTHTNNYHTLFGGHALSLMDRLAYVVSSRYARKHMVTVASENPGPSSPTGVSLC